MWVCADHGKRQGGQSNSLTIVGTTTGAKGTCCSLRLPTRS
jgi:hypothetical protein